MRKKERGEKGILRIVQASFLTLIFWSQKEERKTLLINAITSKKEKGGASHQLHVQSERKQARRSLLVDGGE